MNPTNTNMEYYSPVKLFMRYEKLQLPYVKNDLFKLKKMK